MRKIALIFLFIFSIMGTKVFSQDGTPADFFTGKWEVSFFGTPSGDGKLVAELKRVDGKLTGELSAPEAPEMGKIKISTVNEKPDMIEIFFEAEGYEVSFDLTKVDQDNLKGSLVGMFDAKAKRIKEESLKE